MRSTERFVDRNGRQTGARDDAFLSVQRKVITVFRNKHVCQQAGGRNALVNDMQGHQGLGQSAANGGYAAARNRHLVSEGYHGPCKPLMNLVAELPAH